MANSLTTFNQHLTNNKVQAYLGKVLGDRKEQFVTNCISLVSNNVNLQNCDPNTIMFSAMKATSLGLPLDNNLGFAYVLPYKNKKKNIEEAQFQIGYKGIIQLAMRSGQFKTINVTDVREKEIIANNRLTGEIGFNWLNDEDRAKSKVVGYVAYFKLTNGFEKSFYMSIEKLQAHGQKYSKSYNTQFSNWKNMFESMAEKTVLKLLLSKYAPMSITQIHDAIKYDQAVVREDGKADYVDNKPETIDVDEIVAEKEIARIKKHIKEAKTVEVLSQVKDNLPTKELEDLFISKQLELTK